MFRLFSAQLSMELKGSYFNNLPYYVFSSSHYRPWVIGSNLNVNIDIFIVLDRE